MMSIKRHIIVFFCLLSSLTIAAHSPDVSSTLLVEESESNWILQIRAALTAFEYEVELHFGSDSYTTPEEFQELVLDHVLKNVSIKSNDILSARLSNGSVKLGHETSVTFEVLGMSSSLEALIIKNQSFKDIPRNQSALIILKKGVVKDQFVLDKNNDHTADLQIHKSKLELRPSTVQKSELPLYFSVAGILLFVGALIGFNFFRSSSNN